MNDVTELEGTLAFGEEGLSGSLLFGGDISGSLSFEGITAPTGTFNYEELDNKPSIEGTTLIGDKTLPEIGVGLITPQEIDQLIYG